MWRETRTPRPEWREHVEQNLGFIFHTIDNAPYWDESASYVFTRREIDTLERATNELQRLCLRAAEHILERDLTDRLAIPREMVPLIRASWEAEPPSIYGRFDLAFDGASSPKLLEYNADTPTALFEAAVVQWDWLQEVCPRKDQFNSIHERLIAKWRDIRPALRGKVLHFAHCESLEDAMTVTYLRDTAEQAGIVTLPLLMHEIGWNSESRQLGDLDFQPITDLFKLYPWEWLHAEAAWFEPATLNGTQWIEPAWKMLWSNKGLLPILWELFPGHPNLLPAYFDEPRELTAYARKPLLSREGANITIVGGGTAVETGGDYGEEGYIYQALAPIPEVDGNHPVIGSWLIDGESAGIGIRESVSLITANDGRFIPHYIDG